MHADDATAPEAGSRPWRKRHPVLARVLLYALGAGLAGLLIVLFVERGVGDRARDQAALASELDDLSLVLALDPTGAQVLGLLDEKFSRPDLPVKMRGRALRWRALAHRRGGDFEAAEHALEAAAALDLPVEERVALSLEWAETRLEDPAGDENAALACLPAPESVAPGSPLALLRELLHAQASMAAGEGPETVGERLRAALEALPAPLDDEGAAAYVGGRPWTATQVATVLSEALASLPTHGHDARIWRRLRRLAPHDFDAQVAAARGLLTQGRRDEARAAWQRARAMDGDLAASEAGRDPALASLDDEAR